MIDGNLLQTAQGSFDSEGRLAVKLTVSEWQFTKRERKFKKVDWGRCLLIFNACLLCIGDLIGL